MSSGAAQDRASALDMMMKPVGPIVKKKIKKKKTLAVDSSSALAPNIPSLAPSPTAARAGDDDFYGQVGPAGGGDGSAVEEVVLIRRPAPKVRDPTTLQLKRGGGGLGAGGLGAGGPVCPLPVDPFAPALGAPRQAIGGPLFEKQIRRGHLVATKAIGQGQYGQVYKAIHTIFARNGDVVSTPPSPPSPPSTPLPPASLVTSSPAPPSLDGATTKDSYSL